MSIKDIKDTYGQEVMSAEIRVTDPNSPPPVVVVEDGWIAHVSCNGARWHVLSWSDKGTHCSEPRCIINKAAYNNALASEPTD